VTDNRTIVTNPGLGGRVAGRRNPLPVNAREREELFFETPDESSVLQRSLPTTEQLQLADTPAVIGLFHDPLAATTIARGTQS
jgi:hypothetical protein